MRKAAMGGQYLGGTGWAGLNSLLRGFYYLIFRANRSFTLVSIKVPNPFPASARDFIWLTLPGPAL